MVDVLTCLVLAVLYLVAVLFSFVFLILILILELILDLMLFITFTVSAYTLFRYQHWLCRQNLVLMLIVDELGVNNIRISVY